MLNSGSAITEPCLDCEGCGLVRVRLPGGSRQFRACFTCDGDGHIPVRRCSCGREPCVAVIDEGSSFRRPVCASCYEDSVLSAMGAA